MNGRAWGQAFESNAQTKKKQNNKELIYLCYEEKASARCLNYCMLLKNK